MSDSSRELHRAYCPDCEYATERFESKKYAYGQVIVDGGNGLPKNIEIWSDADLVVPPQCPNGCTQIETETLMLNNPQQPHARH